MRIAIVGSGISGLMAAYQLKDHGEVTVFEANDYIGGHTHTVRVDEEHRKLDVDTGFIVYNEHTYPNFSRLLERLEVPTQRSDMSFALSDPVSGFAYAAPRIDGLFAHKGNALRPSFLRMLLDIVRFSKHGPRYLRACDDDKTIGDFLQDGTYSARFREDYLAPMISAIWSSGSDDILALPARHFLHFFDNHGLMLLNQRPQWRVITGGSSNYIGPLTAAFSDRIHTRSPVNRVTRYTDSVGLTMPNEEELHFDHLVLAIHSNQALAMLSDPTDREREILGAIPYQPNDVRLHTDTTILPKNRAAWASWNYRKCNGVGNQARLTYHMNRLQSLNTTRDYLVSLNESESVNSAKTLGTFNYSHPIYSASGIAAQKRHGEISGQNRTHYCGAYWGYGFHEDGVASALKACAWFDAGVLV